MNALDRLSVAGCSVTVSVVLLIEQTPSRGREDQSARDLHDRQVMKNARISPPGAMVSASRAIHAAIFRASSLCTAAGYFGETEKIGASPTDSPPENNAANARLNLATNQLMSDPTCFRSTAHLDIAQA